jgi:hypothetical protein
MARPLQEVTYTIPSKTYKEHTSIIQRKEGSGRISSITIIVGGEVLRVFEKCNDGMKCSCCGDITTHKLKYYQLCYPCLNCSPELKEITVIAYNFNSCAGLPYYKAVTYYIKLIREQSVLFFNSDNHIKVTESSQIPPPSKIKDIPRSGKKISIRSSVSTRKPRRPIPLPHKTSFTPHKKIKTNTSRRVVVKKSDDDFDVQARRAMRKLTPRPYMHQSKYRR